MSKRITILLSLFYLLISAGGFINIHYCSGQINHIELFGDSKHCGCNHHDQEASHCCEDKPVFIQFGTDQDITRNIVPVYNSSSFLLPGFTQLNFKSLQQEGSHFNANNLPPPSKQPIWLTKSSFLFYG